MTEKKTVPEKAFMESLDSLEALVKGMVPDGAADKGNDPENQNKENLEKCSDSTQPLKKSDRRGRARGGE